LVSSVAVWPLRAPLIEAAMATALVLGSSSSATAVLAVSLIWPPTRRTLPFARTVAVRAALPTSIAAGRGPEPRPLTRGAAGEGVATGVGDASADGDAVAAVGECELTMGPLGAHAPVKRIKPAMTIPFRITFGSALTSRNARPAFPLRPPRVCE